MEKNRCLRELRDILRMAGNYKFLWNINPRLQLKFYHSLPEPDEEARIYVGRGNDQLGFNVGGTYFSAYFSVKREGLNPNELFGLASRLLENKALGEGELINDFVRILVPTLGDYLAKEELSKTFKNLIKAR